MTIEQLIDRLDRALAAGEARKTDLVINVEYGRIHLRPLELDPLPKAKVLIDGIILTREKQPIHERPPR